MTTDPSPTPSSSPLGALLSPRVIAGVLVIALLVVFVVQNRATARIRFLFWTTNTSIAWALLIAAAFGLGLGLALPRLRRLLSRSKTKA